MTNLIPVWKEPTPPPPPLPRLSSKPAYKHRSCHPNSPGPRRTCHRASHMFFLWANSGPRGQRIPLCILSHSAAVGAAPEPLPPPPHNPPPPPTPVSCLTICWRAFTPAKSLHPPAAPKTSCENAKREIWIFLVGGGWGEGWRGGRVKHRVVMGDKGESRVSCIVLNVVTVKRWVEGLWRPFSTQQTHACPPRQREWSPDSSQYACSVTDITKTGKSLTGD